MVYGPLLECKKVHIPFSNVHSIDVNGEYAQTQEIYAGHILKPLTIKLDCYIYDNGAL